MDDVLKTMFLIVFGTTYFSIQIVMGCEDFANGSLTNWFKKCWAKSTDFGKKILYLIMLAFIPCMMTTFCLRAVYKIYQRFLHEIGAEGDK